MIYSTGTISFSGNTVTGSGTNFTSPSSQIRLGQTLIVASNPVQLVQITAINSATSLTVTPAASPAVSGQRYGILVSDSLSVDGLAQSISQLINEYDENIGAWEAFASTTANQNITVSINGVSMQIPALGRLVQMGVNGAVPISSGGTGATDDAGARTNLKAARSGSNSDITAITGLTTPLARGMGGTGSKSGAVVGINQNDYGSNIGGWTGYVNLLSSVGSSSCGSAYITDSGPWVTFISTRHRNGVLDGSNFGFTIEDNMMTSNGYEFFIRKQVSGNWLNPAKLYHDKNTMVDGSGFIKSASPIIKIHGNGEIDVNDESEGVTCSRTGVGEYLITGCMGLHSDAAWGGIDGGFEIPVDRNKQPRIWLDYEVNADGSVLVRTFHRAHPNAPEFARNEIPGLADGEPADIPADTFVSVRPQMPENSIWNLKQAAIIKAMEEADKE